MDTLRSMDPVVAFGAIGDAISKIQDPAEKAAVSMRIFGRSGGEMLTLFNEAGALERAARQLGGLPATLAENAAEMDEVSDRLANMGTGWKQMGAAMTVALLPALQAVTGAIQNIDLTTLGAGLGKVIVAVGKLWPVVVALGVAFAAIKATSLVPLLIAKATAMLTLTTATAGAAAATTGLASAMRMLAAASPVALFVAIAAAVKLATDAFMAQADALREMQTALDRSFASVRKFNINDILGTVGNPQELADKLKEIQDEKDAVRAAAEDQIGRTDDKATRDQIRQDMEITMQTLDAYARRIGNMTEEQMAANQAKRDAAKAEAELAEKIEASAKAYTDARKAYEDAQTTAEKKRVASLPLTEQIEELAKAEEAIRAKLNYALRKIHGDKDAAGLAAQIAQTGDHADKTTDMEAVTELLALEQQRAEILAQIAKEEEDRATTLEKARQDYEAELELLNAQAAGDEERVRMLEREAAIRGTIVELMKAGYDAEQAAARATALQDAKEAAEATEERKSRFEDATREFASRIDAAKGTQSTVASSMQSIGGASGEVYSAGLDYNRQIADLARQQVLLLQEIAAGGSDRIFDGG
jgi:hypothetical protein